MYRDLELGFSSKYWDLKVSVLLRTKRNFSYRDPDPDIYIYIYFFQLSRSGLRFSFGLNANLKEFPAGIRMQDFFCWKLYLGIFCKDLNNVFFCGDSDVEISLKFYFLVGRYLLWVEMELYFTTLSLRSFSSWWLRKSVHV